MFNITSIRSWNTVGKRGFVAGWRAIYSSVPGFGAIGNEFELVLPEVPATVAGYPLAVDPSGDDITVVKKLWIGTEDSKFRATMDAKTGLFSGSMKFFVETRPDSVKGKTYKVSGVVVDGTVYCSAVYSRDGSYAVKVSSCDACED